MTKTRRSMLENNRKLTDFFTQQPTSSFRAPPSSSPLLSSTQKHTGENRNPDGRKTTLAQTQPLPSTSLKPGSRQASQIRTMKKENAPPTPRTRAPPNREVTYVSSASEAPTCISISSTSMLSVDSSVVEVMPPVKQKRRHLQTIDVPSPSPLLSQRRRTPRIQALKEVPTRGSFANGASQPRKQAPKKRKKPEGVQSDDGDAIDLDAMEEAIYVSSKPARIDPVTPEPSVSRKRTCPDAGRPPDASSDAVEVIPSSQSDEQEMNIPRKEKKNIDAIKETVREWQLSSSQSSGPSEASDSLDVDTTFNDTSMDVDFDLPPSSPGLRTGSPTSISARELSKASPLSTPRKNSGMQTPAKTSSPHKFPASVVMDTIRILSGSKSPSPMLASSSSSLTKVDMIVCGLSPKKFGTPATPRTSPNRELAKSGTETFYTRSSAGVDCNELRGIVTDIPILTENEKTDAVVERIKTEARAKAMAMPDEDSMVLGSLDDSDSELGSPSNLFEFAKNPKLDQVMNRHRTSRAIDHTAFSDGSDTPLTDDETLDNQLNLRISTRQQSRRSSSPTSVTTRTRRAPNMLPTTLTSAASAPRKKPITNPLSKLLKEKARQERFAEIRKNPYLDPDVNLYGTAEEGFIEGPSSSSPQLHRQESDEGDLEKVVAEAERRRLFGKEDNAGLGKLLDSERRDKGKGKAAPTELGFPVWDTLLDVMETDNCVHEFPPLEIKLEDHSVMLLKEFIDAKDIYGMTILLQSGMFIIRDPGFVHWLFEIAVLFNGASAITAYTLLVYILEAQASSDPEFAISMSPVRKVLSKFGAKQDVFETLGVQATSSKRSPLSDMHRSQILWRLSELVRVFASRTLLISNDVPSYFVVLLALGMDPKSDINLRLSIKRALTALIRGYCGKFSDRRAEVEMAICSRVLNLIPGLSPANKEYLLSFIDSDDPVARRIVQWIAFAMLTGDYGTRMAREVAAGTPSLSDVIALLKPHPDSTVGSELFNVSRNSDHFESFDYAALSHHVEVLGRVLMNIPEYVLIEQQEARTQNCESFSKNHNEISKLQIIKELLDRLGNNIADTRAAHLDRSQAKAAILQLAVRIHYQRKACIEKPKIENFFKRKST